MVPQNNLNTKLDPVDQLDDAIEQTWIELCTSYDLTAELPNLENLFARADLEMPNHAAEAVVVNMLGEVIESLGRFSPWYTKPARAFGLVSVRDSRTNRYRWMLAPEALQRWEGIIKGLTQAIQKNVGLIQATLLVEDLVMDDLCDEPRVTLHCRCDPPRAIRINREAFKGEAAIVCEACKGVFA